MKKTMSQKLISSLAVLGFIFGTAVLTSCEKEGPAEKAGKEIDKAAENVQDAADELND